MEKSFGIIWGQCSNSLQSNVKSEDEFEDAYDDLDTLWLVKAVKRAVPGIDSKSDPRLTLHKALSELYHLRQGETESDDRFLERFKSTVTTVELAQGASVFCIKSIAEISDRSVDMTEPQVTEESQRSKTILLLETSDPKRYGNLSSRLQESASLGRNEYPRTVSSMYEVLVKQKAQRSRSGNNGSSFTQHSQCIINPNWVLLDTCSTDNVFCNRKLLSSIRKCKAGEDLRLLTNGGFADYDQIGHCDLFKTDAHYNPDSIANVLSFMKLSNTPGIRITADTANDKCLTVHMEDDNSSFKFTPCDDGLYYYDVNTVNKNNEQINSYILSTSSSNNNTLPSSSKHNNKKNQFIKHH